MGDHITFPSNGREAGGYLAAPASGGGPGLVVIQEWWGLVPHIEQVCDRFAAEGFVALAPDLYHGTSVTNAEPDEAGKLMMALNVEQAVKDMSGAVDHLLASDAVTTSHVGVTGFCMGGGLALALACARPDAVSACVPFYGVMPWPNLEPDWSKLEAAVLGHFAENDSMFTPAMVGELEARLRAEGKEAHFIIHPGAQHAFFNDTRPEVHDSAASDKAWASVVPFLKANIT
jgi:carboxymethylenebutenolidase